MEKKLPSRIRKKRNIKIKKSTIGVFVAFFAFAFSMFYVFAGENNRILIEKIESASRGDEIDVSVNLESVKDYNTHLIEVTFDNTVLKYTGASVADVGNPSEPKKNQIKLLCFAPGITSEDEITQANETGVIQLGCSPMSEGKTVNEDIEIAELYFDVLDDAKGGKSPIAITTVGMSKDVNGEKEDLTVDTEDGYVNVIVPVDQNSVKLEKTSFEIQKGETDNVKVLYEPADTSDSKEFTFTSSDTSVVTVDENGKLTAVKAGNVTITVNAFGKELTAEVSVVAHITKVTITGNKTELSKGEELQLSASVEPTDTSDSKTLTWSSTNETVATVDANGKVTAKTGGETTISATSVNNVVATYVVKVVVPMTDFTTTDTKITLNKGESKEIKTTITPTDTTESKEITWTSSNDKVATVKDGTVSAISGGEATITGTLENGKSVVVTVNVVVPIQKVEISEGSVELLPTQKVTLKTVITPEDTTEDTTVVWSSDNDQIATVTRGEVTAVAPGTAKITATVGERSVTATVRVLKPIESFAISEPTVTLNRNDEKKLTVTILPDDAEEDKNVTWTSSDPESVSVDKDGNIKGLKGTQNPVTITGTLKNGKTVESKVTVVVKIDSIELNKASTEINKGESETLKVTINPEDTSEDKTVTWTSSDPTVATVDENGKVTAVGAGNTVITAQVGTFTKECAVKVNVPITSVTINEKDKTIAKGESTTLTSTVNPEDTTEDKTITWSSSNESVAKVDQNGVVTAVGAGDATITAKAGDKTGTVKVTVIVPITEFKVDKTELEIVKGKSEKLNTTINPSDTTEDKTVTWTSSNDKVATVDADGKVTAISEGEVTITGALKNGKKVQVQVTVTIIPVEKITLSEKTLDMKRKETTDLKVTYEPTDATEVTDVTYSSSDETVATVDENGKVTALKEGSATITAKMGNLTDTANVTVTEVPLEDITFETKDQKIEVGKKFKLSVNVKPLDATDDVDFTYSSSDESIATVDADGNVTSKKAGKVTITVTATSNGNVYTKTVELTFTAPSSPKTGVTPIWVYGGIIAMLLTSAIVILKKKELF